MPTERKKSLCMDAMRHGNHFFQQFDFHAAFHSQLEVLFELRGGLDDVFRFSHAFRSANSSSRSV